MERFFVVKHYSIINHTADIGLRIGGRDREELFVHAAAGLASLITDVRKIKAVIPRSFHLKASGQNELFLAWLRELLFVFGTERLLFRTFDFSRLTRKELKVIAYGTLFDPKRHDQKNEVKAVTYHRFSLKKSKSGWTAEVIFDI